MAALEAPAESDSDLHPKSVVEAADSNNGRFKQRSVLVWILLIGVILRVALWVYWWDIPLRIVDAQHYNRLAIDLLSRGAYVDEYGYPTSLRPPLYPAFVSSVYWLFGVENFAAVRLGQAGIGLITTLVVYRIAILAFRRRDVATLAAAIYCFYPSLLGFANLLLSETLFTSFATLFTWFCVEALNRHSLRWLVLAGLALGLGALTRSIFTLFAPCLTVLLFLCWPAHVSRRVLAGLIPALVCAAVIAPWSWRNTKLQQTFTLVDVMGGRNAMMGNYEHTPLEHSWATISIATDDRSWDRVLASKYLEFAGSTQGQRDKLALRYAINYVIHHPWQTLQRDVIRFFNFWQLERTLISGAARGMTKEVSLVWLIVAAMVIWITYAMVMMAAIFGFWFAAPDDQRVHWFLVMSVFFPCAIHTLIFAHSRYHLPIIPIVILYAAAAIVHWQSITGQRGTWRFKAASIMCIVLAAGWVREFVFVDLAVAQRLL